MYNVRLLYSRYVHKYNSIEFNTDKIKYYYNDIN